MLSNGQKLRTITNKEVRIDKWIGKGNQGNVYRGNMGGHSVAVKELDPGELPRAQFLVNAKLDRCHPLLAAPKELIREGRLLATVARFIEGPTLNAWLNSPTSNCLHLQPRLMVAIGLASIAEGLEARHLGVGDQGDDQYILTDADTLNPKPHLVDLDGMVLPGIGRGVTGKPMYMAPELRQGMLEGRLPPADLRSDRYALGVLLNQVLLLRHPMDDRLDCTAPDVSKLYHQEMQKPWADDPLRDSRGGIKSGLAPGSLGPALVSLLRLSQHPDRDLRPSPAEVREALEAALRSMTTCPYCQLPLVAAEGQFECPFPTCGKPWPEPRLWTVWGTEIAVDRNSIVIGRSQVPNPKVSTRHLLLQRKGPLLLGKNLSCNGTFRQTPSGWVRLPDDKFVCLASEDILSLGGQSLLVGAA